MADTFQLRIEPGVFSVTRVSNGEKIFSTDYNYLYYDPTGAIKFPVGQTMKGAGGNLTWQFNGVQHTIANTYYPAGAQDFNTYLIPLTALNPGITASTFTPVEVTNVEGSSAGV